MCVFVHVGLRAVGNGWKVEAVAAEEKTLVEQGLEGERGEEREYSRDKDGETSKGDR